MGIKKKLKNIFIIVGIILFESFSVKAADNIDSKIMPDYIEHTNSKNAFSIVADGKSESIYIDGSDWKGGIRTANDLADDMRKVSGVKPEILEKLSYPSKGAILIRTIGKSKLIDQLIADKKIDVSGIKGQWESFVIQTGDSNLIVAGSDKRGTIYGIYGISEKIGFSPWYF